MSGLPNWGKEDFLVSGGFLTVTLALARLLCYFSQRSAKLKKELQPRKARLTAVWLTTLAIVALAFFIGSLTKNLAPTLVMASFFIFLILAGYILNRRWRLAQ